MHAERERERVGEVLCQSLHLKPPTAGWQPEGSLDTLLLPDAHPALSRPLGGCFHLKGQFCLLKPSVTELVSKLLPTVDSRFSPSHGKRQTADWCCVASQDQMHVFTPQGNSNAECSCLHRSVV